jgi:hypothetical protein
MLEGEGNYKKCWPKHVREVKNVFYRKVGWEEKRMQKSSKANYFHPTCDVESL